MAILFLRFIVLFYVIGVLILLLSLFSKDIVKKKRSLLGLLFFPILLFSKEGRAFLNSLMKGNSK